jgi:hypothetical protein
MDICDGSGYCLLQIDINKYEKPESIHCEHNCVPIKCSNYLICKEELPRWVMVLAKTGGAPIGFQCKLAFGNLEFRDNTECPICFETRMGVKQVNCEHTICIKCFHRCNYTRDYIPQPQFPYSSDIEDEYDNNHTDLRWTHDPLIKKYNDDWILYELKVEEAEKNEACLRICSICRK